MKKLLFVVVLMGIISCESDPVNESVPKDQWVFVACEGKFGASNGSIYMINQIG